ncbi:MAG: DUF2304 domain-containing protein [Acidobacteria bacterium]|nr:MAG: DUF2304 domain-containing protein [Acidobacteriota bacterium]
MTGLVQIIAVAVSAGLLITVIALVREERLREEYAFAWIVGSLVLLALAIWRNSLDLAAKWLGIYYPPALLLLAVILAVFVVSLYFSVVISRQRQQIEHLVEEVALLDAEVRGARGSSRGGRDQAP